MPKMGYFLFLTVAVMYGFINWSLFTILFYGTGKTFAVIAFAVILLI